MNKFLVYDFEVYRYNWHVVFINPYDTNEKYMFSEANSQEFKSFIDQNLKSTIFVGFNSKGYDDNILRAVYYDIDPFSLSKHIVNDKKSPYHYPGFRKCYSLPIFTFDLKNETTNMINFGLSLKEFEAYIGESIVEGSVPFDIDRPLTDSEIEESLEYCLHDVNATVELFHQGFSQNTLKNRLNLIKDYNLLEPKWFRATNAALTAKILGANKSIRKQKEQENPELFDVQRYVIPHTLRLTNDSVLDVFTNKLPSLEESKGWGHKEYIQGLLFVFGLGGLHAAKPNFVLTDGNLLQIDVKSYYPHLIILYNYLSRAVEGGTAIIKAILDLRFELKRQKDNREEGYKLTLNTISGAEGAEFNDLYDEYQRRQMCISGQLFLLDLVEKLAPHMNLIQVNTDGILIEPTSPRVTIENIVKEWEQRTKFEMDIDEYRSVWQRDVNNYIMLDANGKIKTKGSDTKFWENGHPLFNSCTIIRRALVNRLVYDIPVEETIMSEQDPLMFQFVAKVTHKYNGSFTTENGEKKLLGKVNRAFATTNDKYGGLFKYRNIEKQVDGGISIQEQISKIPNSPTQCVIINDNIKDKFTMKELDDAIGIDFNWYIQQAQDKVDSYLGEEVNE